MKTKNYILFCVLLFAQNFIAQEISLLKDINSGTNDSNSTNFKVFDGKLYFTANNNTIISDGTEQGTNEISTNLHYSSPNKGVDFDGKFYFQAEFQVPNEASKGKELCVLNNGTVSLIQDINPDSANADIDNLIVHNGIIYFSANNGTNGRELWIYDPTTNEASLLKNIRDDSNSIAGSSISNMTIHNNLIYFTAQETTSKNELWKTDGTEEGTVKIAVITEDNKIGTDIDYLYNFNGELYFSANEETTSKELWAYNGATQISRIVKDIKTGNFGSNPKNFIEFNGELLFSASSEQNRGDELYKTDGTEGGTVKVKRLNLDGSATIYMNTAFEFDNKLFFVARKGASISYLFSTNGTNSETYELNELADGTNAGIEYLKPIPYHNKIYFRGKNNDGKTVVFETDGTPNSNELKEIEFEGFQEIPNPKDFIVFNNQLFFTAEHSTFGNEIFTLTTEIIQETTTIPDDAFEQFLIDEGIDETGILDDKVITASIDKLTSLNLSNLGITDLTGIEDFAALQELNINDNNALGNFDISKNINLEILDCNNTGISELNISNNGSLHTLSANDNSLTEIDFFNSFNLLKLFIKNNNFITLSLESLYTINTLDCSFNQLEVLSLDNSSNLTNLICNNNNIKELYLGNTTNLVEIIANDNKLVALDIKNGSEEGNQAIQSFNIINNENLCCVQVNDVAFANENFTNKDAQTVFSENCGFFDMTPIPDDNFENALIALKIDDFKDNQVRTINIKGLKSLDVKNSSIDDLTGIQDFLSLEDLDVSNNSLDNTVNLQALSNLKVLRIFGNQIFGTIKITQLVALEELYAGTNRFTSLDIAQNTNLKKLSLIYNDLTTIDVSENRQLTQLDIIDNNLETIDITRNELLEEVNLQGNQLTSLFLVSNTRLTQLFVPNNNINSIDISHNPLLERLGVSNNNLNSLNVTTLENLQFLYTEGNNLTCVSVFDVAYANQQFTQYADASTVFVAECDDLVYLPDNNFEQYFIDNNLDDTLDDYVLKSNIENIETLSLSLDKDATNKIEDLTGIEAFTNLKQLIMNYNAVENLDLSSNLLLENISVIENGLKNITLPETATLTSVDFFNNELSTINVSFLSNLKRLVLTANMLNTIDVSNNTLLEDLHISNNNIENIDVSTNTNLKILTVSFMGADTFMGLNSLDVSNNRLLEELSIKGNNLSVLDITNNIRLTDFEARQNNLTCIKVWDVDFANQNWLENIDSGASFGESCYTRIADKNFEQALIDEDLDTVIDGYIVTTIANNVETLILNSKEISDLSGIEVFTSLRILNLDDNELTSLDLSNNAQLNSLIISNNSLDRLDISNNASLTSFNAINNSDLTCIQVSDVDFANTNWSKGIDSGATFSTDCDEVWTVEVDEKVKGFIRIVNGIDTNNDGEITLKEAKEFAGDLDLSDKNIDDIKGLQAFSNIKSLNLSGNNLKDLSALTGKKITLVSKTTGKKREVAAKTSGLETLIISNNSFETLNLEELKNLKVIDVSNNPNIGTMSIKNGNNAAITSFDATNSPNLTCIIVDDKNAGYLTNFNKDAKSNFVADLADCRSAVLSTQEFLLNDVNIFPNPVTNFLTISSTKELNYIEIYNVIGKRILKTKETKIDFSSFTSGIYFIKMIADDKALTKRVIKN